MSAGAGEYEFYRDQYKIYREHYIPLLGNWEWLYCDLSRGIRWNITWALLSSQYSYSIVQCILWGVVYRSSHVSYVVAARTDVNVVNIDLANRGFVFCGLAPGKLEANISLVKALNLIR